jgi:amidase/aspartyl-tRNA(Asn)/glutamyl-tRNA(Gln) amidotransferase subunit A
MEAMGGHDPHDPFSLPEDLAWRDCLRWPIAGKRIGLSLDFGVFPVDGRVKDLVRDAATAFEAAGANVEEVHVDLRHSALDLGDLWCRLMIPSSIVQVERLKQRGIDLLKSHRADLPLEVIAYLEEVGRYTITDMIRDQEIRTEVYDAIQTPLQTFDFLITPTLACPPVENAGDGNTLGPAEINGQPLNRLIGWCLTFPLNFTGHPAASVPAGLIEGRWPAGLQIIGRKFADLDVLAASAAFERIRPWANHFSICRARGL